MQALASPPTAPAQTSVAHPGALVLPSQRVYASPEKRDEGSYLPTLFDRLCDAEPSSKSEPPDAYALSRTQMRAIVLRDLTFLLNTINQSDLIDAARFPHVLRSTLNYGVPAIAGGYLSEQKWRDIETLIRTAIERFEPRLERQSLRITPLIKDETSTHYNVLVFEIAGVIQLAHYPIEFMVQSAVDLETSRMTFTAA